MKILLINLKFDFLSIPLHAILTHDSETYLSRRKKRGWRPLLMYTG